MGVVERARPPSAFHILKELSIQAYVKFSNFESYAWKDLFLAVSSSMHRKTAQMVVCVFSWLGNL